MASSVVESAMADGPVMSMMNKRLRALRKKHNRILQMEERLAQGKPLNKEQEEVLRSKTAILTLIDEYEKLQGPLAAAVQEELDRASSATDLAVSPPPPVSTPQEDTPAPADDKEGPDRTVIDILTLVYFGCLFDVNPQSEFAAMMLTRTHERGCCLTYDYVTDDATDLLGEQDLDAISALGSFVTSRPVYSGVSHKDALHACLQHAKLWLMNADQPIQPGTSLTYSGLREKLNKILASDYFTTTPEMKAPGDVAAAVGKYGASCQIHISEATTVPSLVVQSKDVQVPVVSEEDEQQDFQPNDVYPDHEVSLADEQLLTDELDTVSSPAVAVFNQEFENPEIVSENLNPRDVEQKEHQYHSRRPYHNTRGAIHGGIGGPGGRRGYRGGGRGGRGGNGSYQNGRSQYYDSNYYPRNYYNAKGRGGRSGGSANYTNHGSQVPSDIELDASA
ncbi:uncharacterized protein LOC122052523 [Zingiber officinale]|uniref:Glycine-rich protein n=1 Tax=Zingiber officinale TaxID=94328 RepID=A0A8J5LJ42_ZINOF|nr:uncharacterized protein LOC122052523 [Zingiber officinale]KAG6522031.1 hypothetical protein ZIOFF_019165 [Zingiber officinale]